MKRVRCGLVLGFVVLLGCGGEGTPADAASASDAPWDVHPTFITDALGATGSGNCVGIKFDPNIPESFHEVCQNPDVVTPEMRRSGAKCFGVPEAYQATVGCSCQVCGYYGGDLLCIKQVCK